MFTEETRQDMTEMVDDLGDILETEELSDTEASAIHKAIEALNSIL